MADKIDSYFKYQSALEREFCGVGTEMPSDDQLLIFIKDNQLDTNYEITIDMVRKDVDEIFAQYAAINNETYKRALLLEFFPPNPNGINDMSIVQFIRKNSYNTKFSITPAVVRRHIKDLCLDGAWIKPPVTASKFLNSNQQYKKDLAAAIISHAPDPLTDTQIKIFIKRNKLDVLYGIKFDDVRSDMYVLKPGYQPPIFVPTADVIFDIFQDSNGSSDITEVGFMTSYDTCLRNTAQNIDDEFENTFTEMLLKYQDLLCDKKRFCALMRDIFPQKRAEVNTLALIFSLGILDELKGCEYIDPLLSFRTAKRLSFEYGIETKLACQMVDVWCNCYGRNILHKECYQYKHG